MAPQRSKHAVVKNDQICNVVIIRRGLLLRPADTDSCGLALFYRSDVARRPRQEDDDDDGDDDDEASAMPCREGP